MAATNLLTGSINWDNYKPVSLPPQPINPSTLSDEVALTNALRAGQINQNQFANRYNQVYNKPVAAPYSVGNTASALGSALNKVFVQPVKAAGVDTAKATEGLGKQLLQAPATQQQRQSIITNQTKAATNPEFQKATVGLNPKNNSAQGYIQAQQMAAKGAKANEIRTFLQQDAAKLNAQTQKGINAATVIGGVDLGSEGTLGKAVNTAKTVLGKNKEVNAALDQAKGNALLDAVTRARSQPITRPSAFDKVEVPQSTELVGKMAPEASTKPTEAPAVTTPKTTPAPSAPKSDLVGTKPEPTPTKPQPTVPTQKVAGSSLRTQAEAVQAGMKAEKEATGATYDTVSHKTEAEKAVKLVQEDPQKAMDIATGKARGDNASHEAAVYHAVKNAELAKAKQTGDYSTVTELANAPRHTEVSEAAQKLGAEGYNTNPHDPLNIMHDIAQTRTKALGKGGTAKLAKETANISSTVKTLAPRIKREDWHSFVDSLKC